MFSFNDIRRFTAYQEKEILKETSRHFGKELSRDLIHQILLFANVKALERFLSQENRPLFVQPMCANCEVFPVRNHGELCVECLYDKYA